MKKYYVVFGVGFGSCYIRPDTRLSEVIEANTERGARIKAKKRWNAVFNRNANDYGFIIECCEELA